MRVRFFDSTGLDITKQVSIKQYIKGIASYPMDMDSTNQWAMDYKRNGGIILCSSFWGIFRKDIQVPAGNANCFHITLYIAGDWFMNKRADWHAQGPFRLLKKKDRLVSLETYFIENGEPKRMEYMKQ